MERNYSSETILRSQKVEHVSRGHKVLEKGLN